MTDKYGLSADDTRKMTSKHVLEEDYLRQVLFNVAMGNRDAHAKNYSFLLASNQVRLAPLYDCLPIFSWPKYNQTMYLSVNGKKDSVRLLETIGSTGRKTRGMILTPCPDK